jgi:hypothetical protein
MAMKVKIICATCQSEDVLADAYAEWNVARQKWEIQNVFDKGAYCNLCGGETRLIEKEITVSKPAA